MAQTVKKLEKTFKMHVKTGDEVLVLSGKDAGKKGKVLKSYPMLGKVQVENINIASKHQKARKAGEESGIVKIGLPINSAKVQVVCPSCKQATRVSRKRLADGSGTRICKKCGNEF